MPRYVALLRAVNVGGRNVRMEDLRALFEGLSFERVETFIASGNVIFDSPSRKEEMIREKLEQAMAKAFGFEVDTFVRTVEEVSAVANHEPFPAALAAQAEALNVGFLHEPLSNEGRELLQSFVTEIDEFHTHGREVYWLCRKKQSESKFSNAAFERKLRVRATFRSMSTVWKISKRFGPGRK